MLSTLHAVNYLTLSTDRDSSLVLPFSRWKTWAWNWHNSSGVTSEVAVGLDTRPAWPQRPCFKPRWGEERAGRAPGQARDCYILGGFASQSSNHWQVETGHGGIFTPRRSANATHGSPHAPLPLLQRCTPRRPWSLPLGLVNVCF